MARAGQLPDKIPDAWTLSEAAWPDEDHRKQDGWGRVTRDVAEHFMELVQATLAVWPAGVPTKELTVRMAAPAGNSDSVEAVELHHDTFETFDDVDFAVHRYDYGINVQVAALFDPTTAYAWLSPKSAVRWADDFIANGWHLMTPGGLVWEPDDRLGYAEEMIATPPEEIWSRARDNPALLMVNPDEVRENPVLLMVNPAEDDEWDEVRDNPDGVAPGEVTRKLDEDMYPTIEKARAGDETAIADCFKRYKKYAKNFAIKYLTTEREGQRGRLTRAAAGHLADDIASEALTRVLVGHVGTRGKKPPAIHRWRPGQSTLATFLSAAIKNVAREHARLYAKGGRARSHTTASGEDAIDAIASPEPSPEEEVVSKDDVDVVDPTDMTVREANEVAKAIDSGELGYEEERQAKANLDKWVAAQQNAGKRDAQRAAVDTALDSAGGDGLTNDEAQILGLRESGMSYKQIASEMFQSDDKKAVQRVMVRLHRARKSLERTTGMKLHGVEANLGGIGYTKRGRKRKNPELVLYFEDALDLEDLFCVGLIDGDGYQACLNSLLQSL